MACPTFSALEFGWAGWVLFCSGELISYKGFSEGCLRETSCSSECQEEEAWGVSAPWGWSSRKQQCIGTSSACFKSFKKKINHGFLFQVIPAGGDEGFPGLLVGALVSQQVWLVNVQLELGLHLLWSFQIRRQRMFKADISHFPSTMHTFPSFFKCCSFWKSLWRTMQ